MYAFFDKLFTTFDTFWTQGSNDVDNATEKVGQLSCDDNQQHQGQQRERTGTGKRKSKKPEQPHYTAKKVIGSNESCPEIGSEASGNNEESSNNKEIPVVVAKPPQQPAKPVSAADDTKSEGGGSNTGTARRNRNKNKSRSSVEKTVSPADARVPVNKDNQQQVKYYSSYESILFKRLSLRVYEVVIFEYFLRSPKDFFIFLSKGLDA